MKFFFGFILKAIIQLYRFTLSPMLQLFGVQCRFTTSCSHYAVEAIDGYGPALGAVLAVKRLLRCNPFCTGGHDPVPEEIVVFKRKIKKLSKSDGQSG